MSKQTAVEWLVKIYLQKGKIDSFDIEQAKAMEREQIMKAAALVLWHNSANSTEGAEQYYNETYKGGEQ